MPSDLKPQTATVNSRLWGARAKDWANLQEVCCRLVYEAVLKRCAVSKATNCPPPSCPLHKQPAHCFPGPSFYIFLPPASSCFLPAACSSPTCFLPTYLLYSCLTPGCGPACLPPCFLPPSHTPTTHAPPGTYLPSPPPPPPPRTRAHTHTGGGLQDGRANSCRAGCSRYGYRRIDSASGDCTVACAERQFP